MAKMTFFYQSRPRYILILREGGVMHDQPKTSVARTISYLAARLAEGLLPELIFHCLCILHCFFHLSLDQE